MAGRKAQPVETSSHHYSRAERVARQKAEEEIRGNSDKIRPTNALSKEQKKIFNKIVKELSVTNTLTNTDVPLLEQFAVAKDMVDKMNKDLNEKYDLVFDKTFMASLDKFNKQLTRCISDLGLSPTARSKIANANAQAKLNKNNPLLNALRQGNDEDEE